MAAHSPWFLERNAGDDFFGYLCTIFIAFFNRDFASCCHSAFTVTVTALAVKNQSEGRTEVRRLSPLFSFSTNQLSSSLRENPRLFIGDFYSATESVECLVQTVDVSELTLALGR